MLIVFYKFDNTHFKWFTTARVKGVRGAGRGELRQVDSHVILDPVKVDQIVDIIV